MKDCHQELGKQNPEMGEGRGEEHPHCHYVWILGRNTDLITDLNVRYVLYHGDTFYAKCENMKAF